MKTKLMAMPAFKSESDEADWWASREGRSFVKRKSAESRSKGESAKGSPLVARLNKTRSVQIALRLPETDLVDARRIATRKGIGYQTLLKMLLHEGLQRESRRR
jgi:predicted DNA binding CopG/RHH family protein